MGSISNSTLWLKAVPERILVLTQARTDIHTKSRIIRPATNASGRRSSKAKAISRTHGKRGTGPGHRRLQTILVPIVRELREPRRKEKIREEKRREEKKRKEKKRKEKKRKETKRKEKKEKTRKEKKRKEQRKEKKS